MSKETIGGYSRSPNGHGGLNTNGDTMDDIISQQLSRAHNASRSTNQNNYTVSGKNTTNNNTMSNTNTNNNNSTPTGNTSKSVSGSYGISGNGYHRVTIDGDAGDRDFAKSAEMIANVIRARQEYKKCDKGEAETRLNPEEIDYLFHFQHSTEDNPLTFERGIYSFSGMNTRVVPWERYVRDMKSVFNAIESGPCLSTARTRLTTMAEKSHLYFLLNSETEMNISRQIRAVGEFAPATCIDNALRLQTSVTAQTLFEFIVSTAVEHPRTPLFHNEEGKTVQLMDYLQSHGISDAREITVQGLGLHPPLYHNKFQPYDVFDPNLNPAGKFGTDLLQAVLSTNGPKDGDLFGALIRPELEKREFKKRQIVATETKLSLYGQNADELKLLAAWVRRQGFNSFSLNMWTICIPRSAPLHGPNEQPVTCQTFGDQLRNIFYPMLMATLFPTSTEWGDVAALLNKTGAISINTEHVTRSQNLVFDAMSPDEAKYEEGVSDCYFFYYIWANLATLNALRVRYGLNTINFCPSVFESAPAYDQLVSSFLLGDVVYHVRSLEKSWIMQYLFMYCRIGVVMSPLRDNVLVKSYFDHPIVRYFAQGLRVSITTSDPLYFHHFDNPCVEEYTTLMKLRSLTQMDLNVIARNSVLNSNFPLEMKRKWLGNDFQMSECDGNDIRRSGVCDYRLEFFHECLLHEEMVLNLVLSQVAKKGEEPITLCMVPSSLTRKAIENVQQLRNPRRANHTDWRVVYPRIDVIGGPREVPISDAVQLLADVISLRKKYVNARGLDVDVQVEDVFNNSNFDESIWEYNNYYGVFLFSRKGKSPSWPGFIPPVDEFIRDVATVREVVMGNSKLHCLADQRLKLLEKKFLLHLSLSISKEAGSKEEKEWNNRDFFTAHKVDTNVHTAAGMNARTLLEFFVEKSLHHGHDVVFEEDNQPVTLRQLLERYMINATRITVDELNHLVNSNKHIRTTFLAVDNFMKGRYFAELTKLTLDLYLEDAFSFSENRLLISGKSQDEWYKLAHWFDRYGMASSQNRWMVCIPRQYRRLRQKGVVRNFGEYLDNIFQPLWEISLHPAKDTKFHYFLAHVSGFDSVDDESKIDLPLSATYPHDWDSDLNPPYNMYLYYFWANIATLNEFRASRGLGTFTFRPQCGELGSVEHLIGGFLVADSINHGVRLRQNPVLEYMYYITQVGVAMSPLSNTAGSSPYLSNPFPLFFRRGLNVSLATNEPLYFHFTREPLIEEYSIAAKLWQFEFNDLSEIARNSVLQSGFPSGWKENALGKLYYLNSTLGNDVRKSRVSDIRVAYRYEVYHEELDFLMEQLPAGNKMPRAMKLLEEEIAIYEEVMQTKVVMPSVGDDEDGIEGEAGRSTSARAERVKAEIEVLDRDIERMQFLTRYVENQNMDMLEAFNRIRTRLKTEGLVVMGNLGKCTVEYETSDHSGGNTASCESEKPTGNGSS
ncbi:putative AMP deaminase, putative,adenosine monophosphate deaminase-like protein [Trypanosoma theileri]|uniref:Putative AMP deaminase, putative,adenosine monophosphate deaminase-like protein n=1 Tax=Trypanosoma theileri TaxID=67003 RepID=A0A1X0NS01_9TRYP|nr:putative AMP deaminase, putative,adenosine monophosphate deaminase-like protein [Trypanosoma theileri]ORC87328.1 putative AMP deaminase, putative,adenosine monophosphate deaminase-like protein [Trypanosoma theileri]